jgi:hypothetical protein
VSDTFEAAGDAPFPDAQTSVLPSTTLRLRARDALLTGRLPRGGPPERMWGGRGTGRGCVVCQEPIGPNERELELEFAREVLESAHENPHVHVPCFTAWQLESRRGELAPTDLPGPRAEGTMRRRGLDLRRESA